MLEASSALPFPTEPREGLAAFLLPGGRWSGGQVSRGQSLLPVPGQPALPTLRLALLSTCPWEALW